MRQVSWDVAPGAALLLAWLFFRDDSGWFAAALPAVLAHEAGHWLCVRLCGGTVREVRLELGGMCMVTSPFSHTADEFFCTLAGPAAGLLWCLLSLFLPGMYFRQSFRAGLVLNLYNLLPVPPLDGGHLAALLWNERCAAVLGIAVSLSLVIAALAFRLWPLLLPGVLLIRANLPTARSAVCPTHASPAGRSAPATDPGCGPRCTGSGRGKSAGQ